MKKLLPILCLSLLSTVAYAENEQAFNPDLLPNPHLLPREIDLSLSPVTFAPRKNAAIAVGLSALVPGLGHVYLGDYKTAGGLIGSTTLYAGLCTVSPYNSRLLETNLMLISNTWFYGIYAAYRDVRAYNVSDVYSYQMPKETLGELALAPFQWRVMKKPEVWAALLADIALAVGLVYLTAPSTEFHIHRSSGGSAFPLMAFPVGIGEESFFRGFLQSYAGEHLSPWAGIAVSSLAFGAAHIPNARHLNRREKRHYLSVILPYITLTGAYYGWVTHKNCSLKESVAMHCWYDFAIFLASYGASKSMGVNEGNFAFSFPF